MQGEEDSVSQRSYPRYVSDSINSIPYYSYSADVK